MSRPLPKFDEFVGQRKIVKRLERQLQGATARGVPLPHALFTGSSGLGKTLLAEALAGARGTTIHCVDGRSKEEAVADKIQQCSLADIVFIDEAHQLSAPTQESLYGVIDHARLPGRAMSADKGKGESPTEFIDVPPVTFILASDQPGKLLNALRRRIQIVEYFRPYTVREMKEIVDALAKREKVLVSPQARNFIARISRGIPRRAEHHLGNLKLHFSKSDTEQLNSKMIREYLRDFEIDGAGLGHVELAYMKRLEIIETASLETLALILGLDPEYVRREIEYPLVDLGFIAIGPQGRRLTESGRQYLGTGRRAISTEDRDVRNSCR